MLVEKWNGRVDVFLKYLMGEVLTYLEAFHSTSDSMFTFVQRKMLYSFRWYVIEEGNELVFVNLCWQEITVKSQHKTGSTYAVFKSREEADSAFEQFQGFHAVVFVCLNPISVSLPFVMIYNPQNSVQKNKLRWDEPVIADHHVS